MMIEEAIALFEAGRKYSKSGTIKINLNEDGYDIVLSALREKLETPRDWTPCAEGMPCKDHPIKRLLRIKCFEPNKVYIAYGVDRFFQYKMRVFKRHKNGAIEYSHPDGGQWMIAIAHFDPLSWCEYVTVRCSIYHDGMITFYADKIAETEQEVSADDHK